MCCCAVVAQLLRSRHQHKANIVPTAALRIKLALSNPPKTILEVQLRPLYPAALQVKFTYLQVYLNRVVALISQTRL